jgi:putative toxin-antitoxin system antitoxin component (TIGR02293 family)
MALRKENTVSSPKKKAYASDEPQKQKKEPATAYAKKSSRAIYYLGGNLGTKVSGIKGELDFILLIKKGIPRKAMDHLMMNTGLTPMEMASIMHTSDRTLRRYKPSKLLNAEQSERVVELARLYSRGEEVFESLDAFKVWMDSLVMSLGNTKPKELLDTSLGIELLMEELGRIEQGVFA